MSGHKAVVQHVNRLCERANKDYALILMDMLNAGTQHDLVVDLTRWIKRLYVIILFFQGLSQLRAPR